MTKRIFLFIVSVSSVFPASISYADTIPVYSVYYNDILLSKGDIKHCYIYDYDSPKKVSFREIRFNTAVIDNIDSNSVFKIGLFKDYAPRGDTIMYLELLTDEGDLLQRISAPIHDYGEHREMIVPGKFILEVLRKNNRNHLLFVYYDNELMNPEPANKDRMDDIIHWKLILLRIIVKHIP
jgi:hypothetical protein